MHFKEKHIKKHCKRPVITIFLLVMSAVFGFMALQEYVEMENQQKVYDELAKQVDKPDSQSGKQAIATNPSLVEGQEEIDSASAHSSQEKPSIKQKSPLPQYIEISEKNPDLYGWIKIDDTVINYPVMYTPSEPEKYLRLNYYGEYSIAGTIFMDSRCTGETDNQILFGHNMDNGTMFGSLSQYIDRAYLEQHPMVHYDTLYEEHSYKIFSVFYERLDQLNAENDFIFYNFIDAVDKKEFDFAIQQLKKKSVHDIDIDIQYGDKILTLVTCGDDPDTERLVVVAKKLED